MKKHYFLAVPIEEKQRLILQNWIQINKTTLPFKSWVHPEDYHITLAFLGDVQPSTRLNDIIKRMDEFIRSCEQFEVSLKGINVFGKTESPRIFWAGVEHSSSLTHLQTQTVKACETAGFELDRKPFRPHITLARKWNSEDPFKMSPGLKHAFVDHPSPSMVTSIHLYQTNLEQIPKYEAIHSFSLPKD